MVDSQKKGTLGMIVVFMSAYPGRSATMLLCLLFSGFSEGIGISTLLPLLNLTMSVEPDSGLSSLTKMVEGFFAFFGIETSLVSLLFLIIAGITLKSIFMLIAMKQVGYTMAFVVTEFRLNLIRSLLKARWEYFIKQPIGSFTNAISTEAMRLSKAYKQACLMLAGVIQVFFYLFIAFLISWQVTILSLIVGVIIIVILKPLINITRKAGDQQTKVFQSILVRLTDFLNGIKPLKAMGIVDSIGPFLESESRQLKKSLRRQVFGSEALVNLQEPLIVIFLVIGAYLLLRRGSMPMTDLMVLAFLFYRTVGRVGRIQKQYQAATVNESAYWSFQKKLEDAKNEEEVISGDIFPAFDRAISFNNVSFAYRNDNIIEDASLEIPFGKLTVLIGPSGAGKTTIADLISGMITTETGDIKVDDVHLGMLDLMSWRKKIGYVPQEIFLFHESVNSNIVLNDQEITPEDVEASLKKAGAWDFVSRLPNGEDTVIGEHGAELSGGQRQRISIARALARKPKLLILDEVTTSLDPKTEAEICSSLLNMKEQMAILAITHQKALIKAADIVYEVKNKQVVRKINPEEYN